MKIGVIVININGSRELKHRVIRSGQQQHSVAVCRISTIKASIVINFKCGDICRNYDICRMGNVVAVNRHVDRQGIFRRKGRSNIDIAGWHFKGDGVLTCIPQALIRINWGSASGFHTDILQHVAIIRDNIQCDRSVNRKVFCL